MNDSLIFLKALTPEAHDALGGPERQLTRFPFRVGRESRLSERRCDLVAERRRPDSVPNNDLYLNEPGNVVTVSREHCQIEQQGSSFVLVDRGSHCGTLVEGERVGGQRKGGAQPLHDNDVIIVGPSESQFTFKFVVRICEDPR